MSYGICSVCSAYRGHITLHNEITSLYSAICSRFALVIVRCSLFVVCNDYHCVKRSTRVSVCFALKRSNICSNTFVVWWQALTWWSRILFGHTVRHTPRPSCCFIQLALTVVKLINAVSRGKLTRTQMPLAGYGCIGVPCLWFISVPRTIPCHASQGHWHPAGSGEVSAADFLCWFG